jgi:plastocyanin
MKKPIILAGAAALVLAASPAVASPNATYKLSAAKTGLKFNTSTIRAKAGKVTLSMANPSSNPHGVAIKGKGKGKTVNKGGTSTVTATLKKGTYTFYCPVPGHEAGGMKGKLIVS